MNIDPTDKARGYHALAKRLNHKHEKTSKTVSTIERQLRRLSREADGTPDPSILLAVVREALHDQINKSKTQKEDRQDLAVQQHVLDELSDNSYWRQIVVDTAEEVESSSISVALGYISYNFATALQNIANVIYRDYGELADVKHVCGGDKAKQQAAIQAILYRSVEENTLESVELSSGEERALKHFFSLSEGSTSANGKELTPAGVGVGEPAYMSHAEVYDLKEAALDKIIRLH